MSSCWIQPIPHTRLATPSRGFRYHAVLKCICSHQWSRVRTVFRSLMSFHVDEQKRFKNATCGRGVFLKWEKKPPFTNWYVRTTGPYAWLRCESSLSQVLRRTHKTTGFFCCEFRHISSQFNYPEKFGRIWRIERDEIKAIKFKIMAQIHFWVTSISFFRVAFKVAYNKLPING